jgi:hypothetical protein
MNRLQETVWSLSSLSIYRGLLDCPVTGSYYRLLQAAAQLDLENPLPFFDAWGAFFGVACDGHAEGNLSGVITDGALYDDNCFSRAGAAGETVSDGLRHGVERELDILRRAAAWTPEEILEESGAAALPLSKTLPRWETGAPVSQLQGDLTGCVDRLLDFYRHHGCGKFVKYRAFIWREQSILPVEYPDKIALSDLKGYQYQRGQVLDNTTLFLEGLPANNCLLYGDRGTGKSSTVKAIMNEYHDRGLRVIEMPKESLMEFPYLVDQIAGLPLKFIIFIDDLSFSKQDETYASLKAVLEGGVASRPDNTLIYATSNRRHLLRETFSDREGDEVHRNDTIEESLSLADRFGLSVNFSHPDKQTYLALIASMAEQRGLSDYLPQLQQEAEQWALQRGGRSPRCATQYMNHAEAVIRDKEARAAGGAR